MTDLERTPPRLWFFASKSHAGIVISDQLPMGELLRRILNLLNARSADDLKDGVHWLQTYR
jgi:hypothetical protein